MYSSSLPTCRRNGTENCQILCFAIIVEVELKIQTLIQSLVPNHFWFGVNGLTLNFMNIRISIFLSIVLTAGFFLTTPAQAMVSPLSINIVPPVQFPPSDFDVAGLRASVLWGHQRAVYGIDLGVLGNMTDVNMVGIEVAGGFNINHGSTTAVGTQLAGLFNYNANKAMFYGTQIALGVNYNEAQSAVSGIELAGLANLSKFTNIYGAQIALYNRAQDVYGLQIGLVNSCSNLHGVQIGLLNFNDKGLFVVSPILNVGF